MKFDMPNWDGLEREAPKVLAGCRTAIQFLKRHGLNAEALQVENALVIAEMFMEDIEPKTPEQLRKLRDDLGLSARFDARPDARKVAGRSWVR